MTRRLAAVAMLALPLAACGPAPPSVDADPPPVPRVEVREVDDGRWQATWTFETPVTGVRFVRTAQYFRERAWEVVTPDFALARDGDSQVIRGTTPSTAVTVEFPVDTRKFRREYEFFLPFTDGSVALYTGHLYVAPFEAPDAIVTQVVVDPGPGRGLVLGGEVHDRPAAWQDPGARGTYAYVGSIEPRRHRRVTMLVDPGVPQWLVDVATLRIPQVFDTLTERTGHRLERRPAALLYHVPGAFPGYASGGGMLEDLLQLGIQGDEWHLPSPWGERNLLRLIAHEAAHLWNGGLARNASGSPPWMHEGGADALAERVLVAIGVMDADALWAAHEEAFNACMAAHDDAPLARTTSDASHYACGRLMALWTERELAAAGADIDLFGFWGALIAHARSTDGTYSTDDYFDVLRRSGVPSDTVDAMRAFTLAVHADLAAAWSAVLASHGITMRRADDAADIDAVLQASERTVFALLGADCPDGAFGFFSRGDHLELSGLGRCGATRDGMRVDRIDSVPIDAPGFAAARAARARCEAGGTVPLGLDDGNSVAVPCPGAWPPLRGYWRLLE